VTTAVVTIMLKPGVLDPQGQAIGQALGHLGYAGVGDVRAGKVIELELGAGAPDELRARADDMARRLLANTVIETWSVELR
jgi:phosphoribosylformylglycinamidine synthase subunit PurS